MDSDGLQESYGDDDDDDDDDDDADDKCGGGGLARSRKEAESTAGHTSPLPHTFELNEIIVPGFYCMWMRDEYVRVERPSHGRVRRVHRGDAAAAAR